MLDLLNTLHHSSKQSWLLLKKKIEKKYEAINLTQKLSAKQWKLYPWFYSVSIALELIFLTRRKITKKWKKNNRNFIIKTTYTIIMTRDVILTKRAVFGGSNDVTAQKYEKHNFNQSKLL